MTVDFHIFTTAFESLAKEKESLGMMMILKNLQKSIFQVIFASFNMNALRLLVDWSSNTIF